MKTIFVSGCYDLLHAGHVQFFSDARALGDHLTVSFASAEVFWSHKRRKPALPDEHKRLLLESIRVIDRVVVGRGTKLGLDFEESFLQLRPDILAVTSDDQYANLKQELCARSGATYHVLAKTLPKQKMISTTEIVRMIQAPTEAPLRVDFAGGWLDVPRFARPDTSVVNCAISPTVSLREWSYEERSGLGGSGAWALLNGQPSVAAELASGVGWQDPAIVQETGCCVWRSGERPQLEFKRDGRFLSGAMALHWTGSPHDTSALANNMRDYALIEQAGKIAREAVLAEDLSRLGEAVTLSYQAQLDEGMPSLPSAEECLARKYCGGGWGGYALFLFPHASARDRFIEKDPGRRAVEPYLKTPG
jgi:cytidyltransferase-like protein